jgi:hypothetical protein
MSLAPIALFVYNRLDHAQTTIEALKQNDLAKDSELFIFSDGPKDNELSRAQVNELREYLSQVNGFKSVQIISQVTNQGLAKSIIDGVTKIVNDFGQVIVVEDDLLVSNYFLEYLNKGLELYKHDEEVASIHAYVYPVSGVLPSTFFLKGADCWGWATWKRGWDIFEADSQKLLAELQNRHLTNEFDFAGSYPYTQMLKDQIAQRNNSWAIRWYASAFLKNKLTLYPGQSLVYNTGFDGSGTHCGSSGYLGDTPQVAKVRIDLQKIEISENQEAKQEIIKYFRGRQPLIIKKITNWLKRIIKLWLSKLGR